ncbi:MAG: endonuclease III [Deltaproteobacteria bacterium]|nr:endonuclease III [Deltaproteobacteria bacterium]
MTGNSSLPEISARLQQRFPDAKYALDFSNPLELLVGTILASQCTDERVNALTKTLFVKYPDADAYAQAPLDELTLDLKPAGMAAQKAKAIQGAAKEIVSTFNGAVPRTMDEMLTLPGVGRKSANVVLVTAYRISSGVIVDTHVRRLAQRIGFSLHDDPDAIELDLKAVIPEADWLWWSAALILHARETCPAKKPRCSECFIADLCPKLGTGNEAASRETAAPSKSAPLKKTVKRSSADDDPF